jgi:hypothetical protein
MEEQAVGISQIRPCRVIHFNELTGKHYMPWDCFNPAISKEIFMYFATPDLEGTARGWNGSGKMTDNYWEQIKIRL